MPTPYELDWTLPAVVTSLVLIGFLFWALGFPSEPFNKTLEENRERVRAWFAGRRAPHPAHGRQQDSATVDRVEQEEGGLSRIYRGWVGFPVWCALAAVLLSLVEPGTSLDPSEWVPLPPLAVAFLIAVPMTTLFYALPAEMYVRGAGGGGSALRFLPGAVVFAAGCVALSRWVDLEPGYVFGLFAFYAAAQSTAARDATAGRGVLLGSLWLLALSVVAWFAWPLAIPAASEPDPNYWVVVADATFVAIFVLGAQTLVFGLIPLEFLDGAKLKRWSRPGWAVLWLVALAVFAHVLLAKFVKEVRDPAVAIATASAFLAFGALSAGFWLAARWSARAPSRPEDGRPAPRLALGMTIVVLLVAIPATVVITSALWADSARAGVARYAATVSVDALRIRTEPSTRRPQIGALPQGTPVDVRCSITVADDTWYALIGPTPDRFVSEIGLAFPEGPRPPPC